MSGGFNILNRNKDSEISNLEYDLRNTIYELSNKNIELEHTINNMEHGYCILKSVYDNNNEKSVDYILMKFNDKFMNFIEMDDSIRNKKISNIIPENEFKRWLHELSNDDNEVIRFVMKSETVNKWYKVTVNKQDCDNIVCVFDDVTDETLYKEKLKRKKEQAERSERMKNLFLANISHEIRTPLNSIIGFSKLLLKKDVNKKLMKEYIGFINNNGEQLLSLLNDIIDMSKLEVDSFKVHKNVFNLSQLLNNIYNTFSNSYDKNNINYILDIDKINNDIKIFSDDKILKQIFNNLISNSIKFTKYGEIKIGCYIIDNKLLKCYIKDTGCGIPDDNDIDIFKRFTQIERDEHSKGDGTGLGLSISCGLIKLLDGVIKYKSIVNKGSIFYFYLPL